MRAKPRDVPRREPDGTPDAGGGDEIIAAFEPVFLRVQRGALLPRFGLGTGGAAPRLPGADELGLTRAALGRPPASAAARLRRGKALCAVPFP